MPLWISNIILALATSSLLKSFLWPMTLLALRINLRLLLGLFAQGAEDTVLWTKYWNSSSFWGINYDLELKKLHLFSLTLVPYNKKLPFSQSIKKKKKNCLFLWSHFIIAGVYSSQQTLGICTMASTGRH